MVSLSGICLPLAIAIKGVDLAGLLGGRMASAENGSVSSGVAYGEGCPLSNQGVLGSVVSPPAGSGAEPQPKTDFGVF